MQKKDFFIFTIQNTVNQLHSNLYVSSNYVCSILSYGSVAAPSTYPTEDRRVPFFAVS